jgi:hypothetical protein
MARGRAAETGVQISEGLGDVFTGAAVDSRTGSALTCFANRAAARALRASRTGSAFGANWSSPSTSRIAEGSAAD